MSEPTQLGSDSESQTDEQRAPAGDESRPGVVAARAQADSNIHKAKIELDSAAELDRWRIGLPALLCGVLAFVFFMVWGFNQKLPDDDGSTGYIDWWWSPACLTAFIVLGVTLRVRTVNRSSAHDKVVSDEEFNVRMAELDYIPETDAPLLANRELLQRYHTLSTGQASTAFRVAVWVMGTATALVIGGAVAAALARTTTTAVTLASLTAFISALGGYVSSTLLATYRVSVEQARHYFREPLAGGYLLAAEHLAATLDAPERATALGRVVDGFIQAATNVPGAAQDSAPSEEPPGATSALS
ncbi:hypothetical protein ACGFWD_45250 [Streptomyces sp. NPDC048448]|uniref:hypothetical protein n=1 Tax=unclassified Streptomyces TaxID=2593676 RepID=UPI00143ED88B|nr:hypothetical protein [Streptomyces sp. RPA4-2]QIY66323.1 hypothetical protein HEP85_38260 [Streptomyces sp. RPA4-2]